MKHKTIISTALAALAAALAFTSCDKLGYGKNPSAEGEGGGRSGTPTSFSVHFVKNLKTAALAALPDTNEFILTVTDSRGVKIYDGAFGAAPEKFETSPGSYTVRAVSCEFSSPLFECPQFGDEQVVKLEENQQLSLRLNCRQLNSGLRLNVDYSFRVSYPDAVLYASSNGGRLMYTYTEARYGFFKPGSITLQMERGGSTVQLFTRQIEAQEMLTINLSASGGPSEPFSGISLALDTCRTWTVEDYRYGDAEGSDISSALSIEEAKARVGEKSLWVYGYVVGGDMTSSSCSFQKPFTSRTNIALAAKSTCKDKEACIAVQLQKGDIRDAVNLVDNPDLLGKKIFLKGSIVEAYFGITGLQNLSEYSLGE